MNMKTKKITIKKLSEKEMKNLTGRGLDEIGQFIRRNVGAIELLDERK